jgi:stage V sporulation protein SpoVS
MSKEAEERRISEDDKEVAGALAALRRARRRAEEIAAATGTVLIQSVDGKVVRVKPNVSGGTGKQATSKTLFSA